MKREVKAAVNFFKRLAVTRGKLAAAKAEEFAEKLYQIMCDKYTGHWYVDCPTKGQAYRCIRINKVSPTEEMILRACEESKVSLSSLGIPPELTVWIDPMEVCVRSNENGRPFSIARFDEPEEVDVAPEEPLNADTSDYHSETSSDCSSIVSSDTEDDPKDGENRRKQGHKVKVINKEAKQGNAYKITMVPRIRTRPVEGPAKAKVVRQMVSGNLQYMHHPAPVWTSYSKPTPVFLTPVCAPMMPPPPAHHQQVYGYFVLQPPSPQFVVPQATLQPWEPPLF